MKNTDKFWIMRNIYLPLILSGLLSLTAHGQAGNLDPAFGNNGIVKTDFPSGTISNGNLCQQLLLLPDGRFYLVFEINEQTVIVRRLPNGSIDPGFGVNGYSLPVRMRNPRAVLQPDQKIVLGGYTMINNSMDFTLARFDINGFADNSFSGDGKTTLDFSASQDYMDAIALQGDGKIVAAGYSVGAHNNFALARFNPDGSVDNSFSGDGKLITDFIVGSRAYALEIQPDGKILAAGYAGSNIGIARYLPDGTPDNSFAGPAKQAITFGSFSLAKALAIQPDQKILIAGYTVDNFGHQDFGLLRLNTNGSLDLSFSGDGKQSTEFLGDDDMAEDVVLQPDAKIILAGSAENAGIPHFALSRYNPDGSPDNSFSGDGRLVTELGPGADFAFSLAVQPDTKILVGGWTSLPNNYAYAAVRYLTDGSLDNSFDGDGILKDYRPGGSTYYQASAIQPDGKILAAGFSKSPDIFHFALARYLVNGKLDNSFSADGMTGIQFGFGQDMAQAVAVQPDGKIVVAGSGFNGSNYDFALARLLPDGTPDNSFSGDGKLLTDFSGYDDAVNAIVIQPDGKILVAGYSITAGNRDFALARYNEDGTPDNSFSGDGKLVTDFGSPSDIAMGLMVQPDKKIIAAGNYNFNTNSDFALARYNPDGSPDLSFNGTGMLTTDFNGGRDEVYAAALQTDGKIVLGGNTSSGSGQDFAVARYNTNGSLDNSFSGDGRQFIDLGSTTETATSLVIQTDGKIILGGQENSGTSSDIALARFNPDGNPDISFSGDGKLTADIDNGDEFIESLDIWDNRLYAVGQTIYGNQLGMVAAFQLDGSNTISCIANKETTTPFGKCATVVNNIDPVVSPGTAVQYTLTGATTANGTGSASGLSFLSGVTTVTYSLVDHPSTSCSFTVTVLDIEPPAVVYPIYVKLCYNVSENYTLPLLQTTDNCGIRSINYAITNATTRSGTGTNASGYLAPGRSNLRWTVVDLMGNITNWYAVIIVNSPLTASIPDAMALPAGVNPNTVYTGYAPASSLTLSALSSGGTAPYSYKWNNGATTSSIVVSPGVSMNYSVTVTDSLGCSATAVKQVQVVDVRCGNKLDKVLVCQVPPGNPSNGQNNCIAAAAVPGFLNKGGFLGNCMAPGITTFNKKETGEHADALTMTAFPNPASHAFQIDIRSSRQEVARLTIYDAQGKLMEQRMITPNRLLEIGASYRPGFYIAELVQGNEKALLKLVRLSD
jgi:uncharacterized delta-60 repeat protein